MGELGIIQLWLLCALYQSKAFPWVFGVGVLKSILSQAFRGCSTGIFLIKLSFLPLTVLSPFKSCSIYSPVLPPILLKQNSPFSPTKPIKALKYLLTSGAEYLLLPGWWILISLMMCACVCLEGKTLPWAVLLTCYRRCCYTVDSKSVRPGRGNPENLHFCHVPRWCLRYWSLDHDLSSKLQVLKIKHIWQPREWTPHQHPLLLSYT